jgi:hypothetical protein
MSVSRCTPLLTQIVHCRWTSVGCLCHARWREWLQSGQSASSSAPSEDSGGLRSTREPNSALSIQRLKDMAAPVSGTPPAWACTAKGLRRCMLSQSFDLCAPCARQTLRTPRLTMTVEFKVRLLLQLRQLSLRWTLRVPCCLGPATKGRNCETLWPKSSPSTRNPPQTRSLQAVSAA